MHEEKEIEIRVDRKSSRNWKLLLQWIWNDDSDCFTNFKGFPVTGFVNRCPIHYFKSLKSMNLLRHSWRKRNRNNGLIENLPGSEITTSMNLKWRYKLFYKFKQISCYTIC